MTGFGTDLLNQAVLTVSVMIYLEHVFSHSIRTEIDYNIFFYRTGFNKHHTGCILKSLKGRDLCKLAITMDENVHLWRNINVANNKTCASFAMLV